MAKVQNYILAYNTAFTEYLRYLYITTYKTFVFILYLSIRHIIAAQKIQT